MLDGRCCSLTSGVFSTTSWNSFERHLGGHAIVLPPKGNSTTVLLSDLRCVLHKLAQLRETRPWSCPLLQGAVESLPPRPFCIGNEGESRHTATAADTCRRYGTTGCNRRGLAPELYSTKKGRTRKKNQENQSARTRILPRAHPDGQYAIFQNIYLNNNKETQIH